MDDAVGLIIGLLVLAVLLGLLVLPIVALVVSVRTRKKLALLLRSGPTQLSAPDPHSLAAVVQQLTVRVARLESTLAAQPGPPPESAAAEPGETTLRPPAPPAEPPPLTPQPAIETPRAVPVSSIMPAAISVRPIDAAKLESIIGRRWLGWVSIALILFATAFFLKYAFDNRWIGEMGRVAMGVAAGVTLVVLGFRYHEKKWRLFSQILTAGGVVLLYLSAYASFGYYHLTTQKAAFVFMAILIAEAAGLALLYDAPAIAVMALMGGFLSPVLLRSDRDQYRSLFGYIAGLDIGALALLKHWLGVSSLAFVGTHLLFWLWYIDNYHPRKLAPVMSFQLGVFLIFLLGHMVRRLLRANEPAPAGGGLFAGGPLRSLMALEDSALLLANPFVFFATAYFLLNPNHHDWMGTLAIGMGLLFAGVAKLMLEKSTAPPAELLLMISIALMFVTLAVPIQLNSNWITMGWALEGVLMLWAGLETKSIRLRSFALFVLALALARLFLWDTPVNRPVFTPVVNKYFLSSVFVILCLLGASIVYQKLGEQRQALAPAVRLTILIVACLTLWFVMTVETYSFFAAQAAAREVIDEARHERWLGQMAVSIVWSIYAAVLMSIGFIRRAAAIRWAALLLFGLTVIKVMMIDLTVLRQLYRIIAFLVLGLLLLLVAWGYHKAAHSKEPST